MTLACAHGPVDCLVSAEGVDKDIWALLSFTLAKIDKYFHLIPSHKTWLERHVAEQCVEACQSFTEPCRHYFRLLAM